MQRKFPLKIGFCTACKQESILRIIPVKSEQPVLFNLNRELCWSCISKLNKTN